RCRHGVDVVLVVSIVCGRLRGARRGAGDRRAGAGPGGAAHRAIAGGPGRPVAARGGRAHAGIPTGVPAWPTARPVPRVRRGGADRCSGGGGRRRRGASRAQGHRASAQELGRGGVATVAAIGIDVGGTSVRAGVVDASGGLLDTARTATARGEAALEEAIAGVVGELRTRHDVEAVGLAVAGFVGDDRRTVMFAPHLPWRDADVADRIADRVGLPVTLEHDANAATFAEHRFGAARGCRVGVFVALGTGIGAGLLLNGELFRGAHGVAPELGHLCLVPGGRTCPCGKAGCWERYCSGTALAATA